MLNRLLFLAQIDLLDPTANKPTGPNFHFDDTLVIVVAALVVAVLLFLATYLSRRNRHGRRARTLSRSGHRPSDAGSGSSGGFFTGRRRRRKRHRDATDERPRNPTLGETGGLPPPRPEDGPTPAADEPTQ